MFGKIIIYVSKKLKGGLYLGTNFMFIKVLIIRVMVQKKSQFHKRMNIIGYT
jgi:hypothetical protein